MSNDLHADPRALDDTDRAILAELAKNARMPNNALAEAVGIAASTCLSRVRLLRETGVIRGFRADIDPAAVGRPLQAMIAVRLDVHKRDEIDSFEADAVRLPGVLSLFHVAGSNDYLLHVAVPGPDALRDFVLNHLTARPSVRHAETSLIFERKDGYGLFD
jgi:DNA-binding Lrp family transcriptional regulator